MYENLILVGDVLGCPELRDNIGRGGFTISNSYGSVDAVPSLPLAESTETQIMLLTEQSLDDYIKASESKRLPPAIALITSTHKEAIAKALKASLLDVIPLPFPGELIEHRLQAQFSRLSMSRKLSRSEPLTDEFTSLESMINFGHGLQRAIQQGQKAARSTIPILIEGEMGVGKTLLAKSVRQSSERRNKPFLVFNCAAMAPDVLEQELFGQNSRLQECNGGTLLLEEVGCLSQSLQQKLAELLNTERLRVAGAPHGIKFNARLIATTSRSLIEQVRNGLFLDDLYYRISVFPITLPSLRDRVEDIAPLAMNFLRKFSAADGRIIDGIDEEALALLESYSWPGNVRELQTAIYRATLLADSWKLSKHDFPGLCEDSGDKKRPLARRSTPEASSVRQARPQHVGHVYDSRLQSRRGGTLVPQTHVPVSSLYGKIELFDDRGNLRRMSQIEDEAIRFALSHAGGNMSLVARDLGIGRTTLYRKARAIEDSGELYKAG